MDAILCPLATCEAAECTEYDAFGECGSQEQPEETSVLKREIEGIGGLSQKENFWLTT